MEVFMAKSKAERGRFSSRKKMDVVLRVLRGDDLDLVSREAVITAATVSEWRDQFLPSGQAGLKSRATDSRADEHSKPDSRTRQRDDLHDIRLGMRTAGAIDRPLSDLREHNLHAENP